MTKLTPAIVGEVRRRFAAGEGITSIARDVGVSRAHVWSVATGQAWKSVPMPDMSRRVLRAARPRGDEHHARRHPERVVRGSRHGQAKLDEAQAAAIRERYRAGESVAALARAYDVSNRCIDKIVARATWRHVEAPSKPDC